MYKLGWKFYLNRCRLALAAPFREIERAHKKRLDLQLKLMECLDACPDDPEKQEILAWLEKHELTVFPYDFPEKYQKSDMKVAFDGQAGVWYGLWHGRKMYLKKSMSKEEAKIYLRNIIREQDPMSPHCYHYEKDEVSGKTIADFGAAEGFFSLDVVEDAKKVYLFECDPEWIDALRLTFAPWKEKVEIIEKFVDQYDSDTSVTLDHFFEDGKREIDFIKADIEGFEAPMLRGGGHTLPHVSNLVLCAYHKQRDEQDIRSALAPYPFEISTSYGYMFFPPDEEQIAPYIRRGLIYAKHRT